MNFPHFIKHQYVLIPLLLWVLLHVIGCSKPDSGIGALPDSEQNALSIINGVKGYHTSIDGISMAGGSSDCFEYHYENQFSTNTTSPITCNQSIWFIAFDNSSMDYFVANKIAKSNNLDSNKRMVFYESSSKVSVFVDANFYLPDYYKDTNIATNGSAFYKYESQTGNQFYMVLYTWDDTFPAIKVNVDSLNEPQITHVVSYIEVGSKSEPCTLNDSTLNTPCTITIHSVNDSLSTITQYQSDLPPINDPLIGSISNKVVEVKIYDKDNHHVGHLTIDGPNGFVFTVTDLTGHPFQKTTSQ